MIRCGEEYEVMWSPERKGYIVVEPIGPMSSKLASGPYGKSSDAKEWIKRQANK